MAKGPRKKKKSSQVYRLIYPRIVKASSTAKRCHAGTTVLYKQLTRKVVLTADNVVVKSGEHISVSEAEAMKVAARADIPVPQLLGTSQTERETSIRMSYIRGETLEKVWPNLSEQQRQDIAAQIRDILIKMRSLTPPEGFIGSCDGTGVWDTRAHFTYDGPVCRDEAEFNGCLSSSLAAKTPEMLRRAFCGQLGTGHGVVFTHGDLAPRNIMIEGGRVTGLMDWEESAWYPAYWEVVKFFERPAGYEWKALAGMIFEEEFLGELVTYNAMARWRNP